MAATVPDTGTLKPIIVRKKMKKIITDSLAQAEKALHDFIADPRTLESMTRAVEIMKEALGGGSKIISCGNGGSLCDATHFAEELTGRFRSDRRPLPAMAINDAAYMTCVGNDFSFEQIFARWVEAFGRPGDVLLAISTSGNSGNIVLAAEAARRCGMKVVVLTADGPTRLAELADAAILAPRTPHSDRIQEVHIKAIHIMIEALEAELL